MNISQWKIGDRTFFSLEVDDRLLLMHIPFEYEYSEKYSTEAFKSNTESAHVLYVKQDISSHIKFSSVTANLGMYKK